MPHADPPPPPPGYVDHGFNPDLPPPPPPPWLPYHTSQGIIADENRVTVTGEATQLPAACLVRQLREAHHLQAHRAAKASGLRSGVPPPLVDLVCAGAVGIVVRASAGMVLLQGLAAEVAASVGLPTHLQPLKMFAPDIIGLEALDTLLRESVHGRFVAGARRTANLTVPRSARGELRVPRLENVNPGAAANLSVPSAVRWTTPFVRHSLVLRHRPAVDLGGDPSNIYREFVVPPSGSSVDEMLTSSEWVRLYAVPAHVDLFEELHRMWVGKDNPQVVAAAALNCVLLVDVERLARNGPSSSGVCELGGFHAFAARMLAPHPDDARDGVRPSHNAFLAWLAATFGAGNRDEFARNCVHTVVPYWPILHDYLPLDMLQNLFDARAAFFASAFVRIHALSVPVDGPVQAGSTHPHHGHPHHAHS